MRHWIKILPVMILLAVCVIALFSWQHLQQPTKRFFHQDTLAWLELTYENSEYPKMIAGVIRTGGRWRYELMGSNQTYKVYLGDKKQVICSDGNTVSGMMSRLQSNISTSLWERLMSDWPTAEAERLHKDKHFDTYLLYSNQNLSFNVDSGLVAQFGNSTAMESIVYLSLCEEDMLYLLNANVMRPLLIQAVAANAGYNNLIPGSIIHVSLKNVSQDSAPPKKN